MSKYQVLVDHLNARHVDQIPMKFQDVEKALGFRLPSSARRHQAWWANTAGSHVHAAAWMKSGWRTTSLDLGAERIVFIREEAQGQAARSMAAQPNVSTTPDIVVSWSELNVAVRQLLDRIREMGNTDLKGAVLEALNAGVIEHRRRMLDEFRVRSIGPISDSVDLIHEDREERP